MSSFTYAELVAALQSWPVEYNAEYTADIPRIIGLGETRLVRELNLELFDFTDPNLLAQTGDRQVVKPTDMIVARSLFLVDDGVKTPLLLRSQDYCNLYSPDSTVQAQPKYYCEFDEFEFMVVPTPDDDYSIECKYVRRPEGLSASNAETWLSTKAGDMLFACCLMEAEHWIKADDRYGDMKDKFYSQLLPTGRLELRNVLRSGDYQPFKAAASAAG